MVAIYDWPQYVERLEHFFVANGIDDVGKKRAVLLSVVGAATLRNILSPEKPGEKTYTELVEKLARHFKPAPSEIVERFKFHSRVRRAGESIATYVAELRSLSEYCNFGATLNDMLRDRLVCGVNDGAIQKTLLAQVALTYEKAAEIALNAEAATQSMRGLGLRSESGLFSRPTPLKEPIPVVGCCNVNLQYKGQSCECPLVIVRGSGPTLLGRDWLCQIQLDWREIHTASLQAVLYRYPGVFQEGLEGFKAKIYVEPDTPPRFFPARSVPYAMRDKVDKELQRLQRDGVVEPVEIAEWAAPIVIVLKKDSGNVRICGDFRITVNPVSKLERYPIVEDLFARLSGGKHFTKLDLSHAYQQLPLDVDSMKYVVVNTHKGLFRYTRLPFGTASAPGIFQRVIESILQGIEGAVVYLDDILITGSSEEAHLKTLDEVLSRLDRAGLRVRREKCAFMRPTVTYLGHKIDADGLHPVPDRVTAIQEAPSPKSVSQLRSFLGMLSYYSKFLPSLSTILQPLYRLLKKDVEWKWGVAQAKASRKLLTSGNCLTHFDSSLELTLACDAC